MAGKQEKGVCFKRGGCFVIVCQHVWNELHRVFIYTYKAKYTANDSLISKPVLWWSHVSLNPESILVISNGIGGDCLCQQMSVLGISRNNSTKMSHQAGQNAVLLQVQTKVPQTAFWESFGGQRWITQLHSWQWLICFPSSWRLPYCYLKQLLLSFVSSFSNSKNIW